MRPIAAAALIVAGLLTPAPAHASSALGDSRATLLASWTQPTRASAAAWDAARADPGRWAAYDFDWSTDLCSRAPEAPFGFVFADACRRHDFGYRNYRSDAAFAGHKKRIDKVFRADLRRACNRYREGAQPLCDAVAWTYYQTVRLLGTA
jgi:hypothetical protein